MTQPQWFEAGFTISPEGRYYVIVRIKGAVFIGNEAFDTEDLVLAHIKRWVNSLDWRHEMLQ